MLSTAIFSGGLFDSTRRPWFAATVVLAAAGWVLPALSLRHAGEKAWPTLAIWSLSFLLVSVIGETLAWRFERSAGPGFFGYVIAAGLGGAIGHLGRAVSDGSRTSGLWKFVRIVWVTILAAVAFAAAAYIAILGSYLGQILKNALESVWGWRPGMVLGIALGGALAGCVAGAASAVTRPSSAPARLRRHGRG